MIKNIIEILFNVINDQIYKWIIALNFNFENSFN